MLQRGRKSAAALSVVPSSNVQRIRRLRPPRDADLMQAEVDLFNQVVNSCSADHFVQSDAPLLVTYVQSILIQRWAFREVQENRAAYQIWQQSARTLATLATKLRLCPHSRTSPKTITRHQPGIGISATSYLNMTDISMDEDDHEE